MRGLAILLAVVILAGLTLASFRTMAERLPPRVNIVLEGQVGIPSPSADVPSGTLHVLLENVTEQDGAPVAEVVFYRLPLNRLQEIRYPYALGLFSPKPDNRYTLRVHFDADGDGKRSVGDYYGSREDIFDQHGLVTIFLKQ